VETTLKHLLGMRLRDHSMRRNPTVFLMRPSDRVLLLCSLKMGCCWWAPWRSIRLALMVGIVFHSVARLLCRGLTLIVPPIHRNRDGRKARNRRRFRHTSAPLRTVFFPSFMSATIVFLGGLVVCATTPATPIAPILAPIWREGTYSTTSRHCT
jgi:hypothetical protein